MRTSRIMNSSHLRRRTFLKSAGVLTAAFCLTRRRTLAEDINPVVRMREAAATAKITVTKLRGNVSVLTGSGGNIAVLTGADEKLLVDAGLTASRAQIREALASIGGEPVARVINTHWHFDHTDGNEWLHSTGAEIMAHENTRKHLSKSTRVEAWNFTFPPSPEGALPANVLQQDEKFNFNGSTIALKYYGPCHTDSDLSVYFSNADILHCGDTWWNGHFPFIDYNTGGSIGGMIRAAEMNIARVTSKTLIIPGHGDVGGKAELVEYRNMLLRIRDTVAALKKQGKSLDEVLAINPAAEYEVKWGGFVIDVKSFTTLVYTGV